MNKVIEIYFTAEYQLKSSQLGISSDKETMVNDKFALILFVNKTLKLKATLDKMYRYISSLSI